MILRRVSSLRSVSANLDFGCLEPSEVLVGFLLQFSQLLGGDFSHEESSLLLYQQLASGGYVCAILDQE